MPRQGSQQGRAQQQGGRTAADAVAGSVRTLANGAQGALFEEGGKRVFRIFQGANAAAMANARAARSRVITQDEAQAAFDKYYSRNTHGYKSRATMKRARGQDLAYSGNVTTSAKYLSKNGPRRYDFAGVDAGSKKRTVTPAQAAALARGRAALAAKRQAGGNQQGARQQGGNQQGARQQGARQQGARQQGARQQGARQQGGYWW
jgi:hypothetical protein